MHKATCKSNENQSGTTTEDIQCLDSHNHAMGTTYEASLINIVLDNVDSVGDDYSYADLSMAFTQVLIT